MGGRGVAYTATSLRLAMLEHTPCRRTPAMALGRWAMLATLLLALVAPASSSRVVVFETGAGESEASDTFHSTRSYVVIEQHAVHDVHGMMSTVRSMLRPFSWVYQQLEAIEAMQQASLNTFLLRYHEASTADPDDEGADNMLHHLGCKRFAAAMDEYLQAVQVKDAEQLQLTVEMVEAAGAEGQLADGLKWDTEHETLMGDEQGEEEGQRLMQQQQQDPYSYVIDSRADEDALLQQLSDGMLDDGSTLIVISTDDAQPRRWDSLSEAIVEAQEALEDYQQELHHQQHGVSELTLLRGRPDRSGSEDPFLPLVDLESEFLVMRQQQHATHVSTAVDAGTQSQEQGNGKLPHPSFTADAFNDADRETFDWVLPALNLNRDWPMLLLISLAMAAMATAFIVSWMQLQAAVHCKTACRSLPMLIRHNGRLVHAVVLLPEEDQEAGTASASKGDDTQKYLPLPVKA